MISDIILFRDAAAVRLAARNHINNTIHRMGYASSRDFGVIIKYYLTLLSYQIYTVFAHVALHYII